MKFKFGILLLAVVVANSNVQAQERSLFSAKLAGIARDGGHTWIYFKEGLGTYTTAFFERNKAAFELTASDEMRLVKTESDTETGLTHYFHQQYYKGYKVLQGQINIHVRDGKLYKANGQIVRNNTKAVQILLSKKDAENSAYRLFESPVHWLSAPTELVWVAADNNQFNSTPGNLALAYRVEVKSKDPIKGDVYFIDAATGKLILSLPSILSCNGTTANTVWYGSNTIFTSKNAQNVYEMRDDCGTTVIEVLEKRGIHDEQFSSANNTWTGKEHATTALLVAKRTVQYYLNVHNRKSWDNADHRVVFLIDEPNCYFCIGSNAYAGDTITFGGNRTPAFEDDFYTLDVFGHEFTHNVTRKAVPGGLNYAGESGALNESFSDIMGNALDMHYNGESQAGDVWLVGEDRVNASNNGLWLRDMRNPNLSNPAESGSVPQPKKINGLYWKPTNCGTPDRFNDYCGVHYNSGVQNYMFYLLSEGGMGTNEGAGFALSGIGILKSRRIAYKTLTGGYLTSFSTYAAARDAWVQAAADLYGNCSFEAQQTAEAWYAAGLSKGDSEFTTSICGMVSTAASDVFKFSGTQVLIAGGNCSTTISPSSNVTTFSSNNAVLLKPGFLAPAGSVFKAAIGACNLVSE